MRKILWELIFVALLSLTVAVPAYCQGRMTYTESYELGNGETQYYNGDSCGGTLIAQNTEAYLSALDGFLSGDYTNLTTIEKKSGEVKQQNVNASLVRLRDAIEKNESGGAYETIRKYTQSKDGSSNSTNGNGTGGGTSSGVIPGIIVQWISDDKIGTGQGVYIDDQNPEGGEGEDETPGTPCVTGYMNDGTVIRSDGTRTVIAPNSSEECAKDAGACNDGTRGTMADQLLDEVGDMVDDDEPITVDDPDGEIVPEGKWVRGNAGSWTPPSREYVPKQKTTRWGVEYAGISVGVDLDLTEGGTSSNTVRVGADDDYIEATLTASVHYEIVHDKTNYKWNIQQPDGTWFLEDYHTLEVGETVRLELKDAGTYKCQTIPRHYYHVNRYISYTVEGVHHKVIPGECEDREVADPNDPSKTIIVCEDTGPVILDMPLGTVSDVKSDMNIHSGTIIDYENQLWHTYDNPAICVGCPGTYWCVGCLPEVCDENKRYVCDDNVNELEISPYSFLTE